MFNLEVDDRLSAWSDLRKQIDSTENSLELLASFWGNTPFTPHNPMLDPFYQGKWPTPWEIIVHNKYDDFTKAVMIGYTLLLTETYKDSNIVVKTLVDDNNNRLYNVTVVDNSLVLNYVDNQVVQVDSLPSLYRLENLVQLDRPR